VRVKINSPRALSCHNTRFTSRFFPKGRVKKKRKRRNSLFRYDFKIDLHRHDSKLFQTGRRNFVTSAFRPNQLFKQKLCTRPRWGRSRCEDNTPDRPAEPPRCTETCRPTVSTAPTCCSFFLDQRASPPAAWTVPRYCPRIAPETDPVLERSARRKYEMHSIFGSRSEDEKCLNNDKRLQRSHLIITTHNLNLSSPQD